MTGFEADVEGEVPLSLGNPLTPLISPGEVEEAWALMIVAGLLSVLISTLFFGIFGS
jgi:hypothetical protein